MSRGHRARALLVAVIAVLALGGNGCMEKNVDDRIIEYLTGKYDDEFTDITLYGGYNGIKAHKYTARSETLGSEVNIVVYDRGKPGERFYDNYLSVKFEDAVAELIRGLLAEALELLEEEIYLEYGPNPAAKVDWGCDDTSFSEYIAEPSSYITFSAGVVKTVPISGRKLTEEQLETAFREAGLCCTGRVYFVDEASETLTDGEHFKTAIGRGLYGDRFYFQMVDTGGFEKSYWENK